MHNEIQSHFLRHPTVRESGPNCPGWSRIFRGGPACPLENLVCGWQQTLILKPYCPRFWPCTATAPERKSHLCALGSAIFVTPLWRIFLQGFLRYRESSTRGPQRGLTSRFCSIAFSISFDVPQISSNRNATQIRQLVCLEVQSPAESWPTSFSW